MDCCRCGRLCCNADAVNFVADTVHFVASVHVRGQSDIVDRVEFNFVASVYRAVCNKLPASLRSSDSLCQFRRQLKTFLFIKD